VFPGGREAERVSARKQRKKKHPETGRDGRYGTERSWNVIPEAPPSLFRCLPVSFLLHPSGSDRAEYPRKLFRDLQTLEKRSHNFARNLFIIAVMYSGAFFIYQTTAPLTGRLEITRPFVYYLNNNSEVALVSSCLLQDKFHIFRSG
jgi:hypothetical protein